MFAKITKIISRYQNIFFRTLSIGLAVAALTLYGSWANEAAAADAAVEQQIMEAERAANRGPYLTDGVFVGSAEGYGGLVTMQATIEDGWITVVDILDVTHEDQEWIDMCLVLPERIIKAQGVGIDVIASATYTSAGMLNGTAEALKQSMNEGSS